MNCLRCFLKEQSTHKQVVHHAHNEKDLANEWRQKPRYHVEDGVVLLDSVSKDEPTGEVGGHADDEQHAESGTEAGDGRVGSNDRKRRKRENARGPKVVGKVLRCFVLVEFHRNEMSVTRNL